MEILSTTQPLHLLIVERDDNVRDILASLFISQGYTVSRAKAPEEALKLVVFNVARR